MLRALAVASVLALTAGAAVAQPPGDPNGYGAQPPAQPAYPPPDQGYGQPGAGAGYGAPGQGQGGGHGWGHDPAMRAMRQRMRAACATDISTYCGGAGQGGRGALHQCMMANQARFSPPCQSAIADMHAQMQQMRGQGGPPGGAMPPGGDMPPPNGPQ